MINILHSVSKFVVNLECVPTIRKESLVILDHSDEIDLSEDVGFKLIQTSCFHLYFL